MGDFSEAAKLAASFFGDLLAGYVLILTFVMRGGGLFT